MLGVSGNMCTGIVLRAGNGAVVRGRTMEWGSGDIGSRIFVARQGREMQGTLPDDSQGLVWKGRYGFAGIDAFGQFFAADGLSDKGLTVGLFYHAGTAVYEKFDRSKAETTMSSADLGTYALSMFSTVKELREGLDGLHFVGHNIPGTNVEVPCHYLIADASGDSVVIEFLNGKLTFFDDPVGVITNSPSFDWHLINLRNYLHFTADAARPAKYGRLEAAPMGHGSGLLGLPGDFTPPSRFVRAATFVATARPTKDADDAVLETMRIMDNFNLPIEPAATAQEMEMQKGLLSSTTWTTISDTRQLRFYYHTQFNRRLRLLDLKKLDLGPGKEYAARPLDTVREQDVQELRFP